MDKLIDLDAAKAEIDSRVADWQAAGLTVGAVTWRDQGRGWPPPITTNRDEVIDADSVGVTLRKGQQEGEIVLFAGGWADFDYWPGRAPMEGIIMDAPGLASPLSVSEFGDVLDRLAALFS